MKTYSRGTSLWVTVLPGELPQNVVFIIRERGTGEEGGERQISVTR